MQKIIQRMAAILLAAFLILSVCSGNAQAESIHDGGSQTVTIHKVDRFYFLSTSTGNTLGGGYREYLTNNNLSGPAFCINWGLKDVPSTKALTIAGRYTTSPKTMGAFANGYPQIPLADFLSVNSAMPELAGLTEDEYTYATQVAIWATLGQVAVEGTQFTSGRATITRPTNDPQKIRVYKALEIILYNSYFWRDVKYTGMYVRAENDEAGHIVDVAGISLSRAAEDNTFGIKRETIGGTEYFTRQFIAASATSTFPNNYFINLWSDNAPTGTIFTDTTNTPLATANIAGRTAYKVPTTLRTTNLNANGEEYSGAFKICVPVSNVTESGEIKISATSIVKQYDIYLAKNPANDEQSFIIADPATTDYGAHGILRWNTDIEPGTSIITLSKVDGGGNPLPGATFELKGADGTTKTGTSSGDGLVTWTDLNPNTTYTVRETQAPESYALVEPVSVTVQDGQTSYVTVRNNVEPLLTVRKLDAQNGYSLLGAVFKFEQIDGSFSTSGTTGHDGLITFDSSQLPFGSYKITETQAPEGYRPDTTPQTVDWNGTADVMLTFQDVREPTLVIIKVDANTARPLSGATLRVYKDGQPITTVTTNDAGEARIPVILEAYYEVEEIATPSGYVLDATRHGIHIDPYNPAIDNDPVLIVPNQARPSLRILKYDMQSQSPMSGVTFEVYCDTVLLGQYMTDSNGEILLSGLQPGTYLVKEVATDSGHVINSTPQQIEIKAGDTETAQLIFLNQLKPGIHLVKLDSQSMKPLVNATYKIKKVGGTFEKEYTTNASGEITLTELEPGAYQVIEVKAPDGYLIDDGIRTIQINPDENALFVFTDTKKPSLEIVKYDPVADKYLGGATFKITKVEDGSHYLDRITDLNGKINIDNLDPGVYSVQEMAAPSGYVLNDYEYHVELFPGQSSQVVVNNEKKPDLQIIKTDAITGQPIPGTTFTVRKVDSSTLTTVTTDAQGQVLLEKLDPGVYQIIEQSVPHTHLLDQTPQLITLVPNKTGIAQFQNYPKPSLTINKVDSITKDPIKGAKFQILYASNNTFTGEINDLGTYFTDEQGQIIINKLADGWYRIKELEPAPGYTIKAPDTQDVYINAGEGKSVTFENIPKSAIIVRKVDAQTGQPIPETLIRIRYLAGTSGSGGTIIFEGRTSPNGIVTITDLDPGTYIVEEVTPNPDYQMTGETSKTVYISGDEQAAITVELTNHKKGQLIIKKLDSATNKPLAGAVFTVTDSAGQFIGSRNGEYTTGADGLIVIDEVFNPGTTIIVREIRCPDGYILDDNPQSIQVKAGITHALTFYNTPKSQLIIKKLDSTNNKPLAGATFLVTDSAGQFIGSRNGEYTTDASGLIMIDESFTPGTTIVVRETSAPDGYILTTDSQSIQIKTTTTHTITFYNTPKGGLQIIKLDEDSRKPIKDVEFTINKMNGERVGVYRTDANGIIYLPNIASGWYTVMESKASRGYELDNEPRNIEVKDGQAATLTITNQKQASILIHKVDSVTGKGIYGTTFLLYDGGNNPIGQYTSDQDGYVWIDGELAPGKYLLRELKAADGYILDEGQKNVYVEGGRTTEIRWENTAVRGQIQVTKRGADDNQRNGIAAGTLLPGAVFEITDKAGNVVDTVTTGYDGRAVSAAIPLGRYFVREVQPPANYSLDTQVYEAELEFSGQIVKLELSNNSVSLGVSVKKRGYNEVVPGQRIRYDFSGIGNTSSVALSSFYWRDTLPVEALRLDKIITGSWNQAISYKVTYKTNTGSEYKVLADNLSSQKVHVLDASPAALGLASNEYVTEYMFVFGQVKAGFAQVEAPYIYCNVLDGLAHETRFVNNTDVGGQHGTQWVMANDRWTTVVYGKPGVAPKLPRTGF